MSGAYEVVIPTVRLGSNTAEPVAKAQRFEAIPATFSPQRRPEQQPQPFMEQVCSA